MLNEQVKRKKLHLTLKKTKITYDERKLMIKYKSNERNLGFNPSNEKCQRSQRMGCFEFRLNLPSLLINEVESRN